MPQKEILTDAEECLLSYFNKALDHLCLKKSSVSEMDIAVLTETALSVDGIERYFARSVQVLMEGKSVDGKLVALYLMDSLMRHTRFRHGDKTVFTSRFKRHKASILKHALIYCKRRPKMADEVLKTFFIWYRNSVLSEEDVRAFAAEVLGDPKSVQEWWTGKVDAFYFKNLDNDATSTPDEMGPVSPNAKSDTDRVEPDNEPLLIEDEDEYDDPTAIRYKGLTLRERVNLMAFNKIPKRFRGKDLPSFSSDDDNEETSADVLSDPPVQGSSNEKTRKHIVPVKEKHMTICTRTVWIGHLPKTVEEELIKTMVANFGEAESVNLIGPRGCAYICFKFREDAEKFLKENKTLIIRGISARLAWASNIGIKDRQHQFNRDIGCAYIPHVEIADWSVENILALGDGGIIDELSASDEVLVRIIEYREKSALKGASSDCIVKDDKISHCEPTVNMMDPVVQPSLSSRYAFIVPDFSNVLPPPLNPNEQLNYASFINAQSHPPLIMPPQYQATYFDPNSQSHNEPICLSNHQSIFGNRFSGYQQPPQQQQSHLSMIHQPPSEFSVQSLVQSNSEPETLAVCQQYVVPAPPPVSQHSSRSNHEHNPYAYDARRTNQQHGRFPEQPSNHGQSYSSQGREHRRTRDDRSHSGGGHYDNRKRQWRDNGRVYKNYRY